MLSVILSDEGLDVVCAVVQLLGALAAPQTTDHQRSLTAAAAVIVDQGWAWWLGQSRSTKILQDELLWTVILADIL